jgi:proton-dependent oligopeptide transporter, POT family
MREKNIEPSTPAKIGFGMFLTGAGFTVMVLAARSLGDSVAVSFLWLVLAYAIITLGELCLSPMGLSLVSKVAPPAHRGLMMGGWFLATAAGNKMSGVIGVHWPAGGHGDTTGVTLWSYEKFFFICSISAIIMGFVMFAILRPLKKSMPGV